MVTTYISGLDTIEVSPENMLIDNLIGNDRLLNYAEVARRMSVSIHTVRGWVYKRKIPFLKAGKSVRFIWGDVLQWLQKNGV